MGKEEWAKKNGAAKVIPYGPVLIDNKLRRPHRNEAENSIRQTYGRLPVL